MEKWKCGVSPGDAPSYAVSDMVHIHRWFYTLFITQLWGFYFYTCAGALSPATVHNPHELSTDLSTRATRFPHVWVHYIPSTIPIMGT